MSEYILFSKKYTQDDNRKNNLTFFFLLGISFLKLSTLDRKNTGQYCISVLTKKNLN
jgi:hypothetical protein